jgi:hypothetical protein
MSRLIGAPLALRRDLDLVGPRDAGYLYQPCLADTATAW